MRENTDRKMFYSIKEVAEMFNVEQSTLRFWEKEFKQIKPKRVGDRKIRFYSKTDISTIGAIHRLLVVDGVKIEKAKQIMSTRKDMAERHYQIKEKLLDIREKLLRIRQEL